MIPANLTAACVQRIAENWRKRYAQHTRSTYTKCMRRFITWLERVAAAPPSAAAAVPRVRQPQPRTSIATDEERRQILEAASPRLRFFLLLCADLGLRHRTAARINLANYNPELRALSFYTKGNVHQTLPVTSEIRQILESIPRTADRNTPIANLRPRKKTEQTTGPNPRFRPRRQAVELYRKPEQYPARRDRDALSSGSHRPRPTNDRPLARAARHKK